MIANSTIDLVNLDFDTGKAAFIAYLRSQPEFKDYDFTGSNINVLLDLLSYNTLKNLFFLNMAVSEGFLDSAQLRPSVLSHAKDLNYTPRSSRSARANVTATFRALTTSQPYIIQKGQSFSSHYKNQSFIFSIPETLTVASANDTFTFTTDIYEGIYMKDTYIFDTGSLVPIRFKITNPNVDTDSIVVNVYEDGKIIPDIYARTTSMLDITDTSKVYFLQTGAVDGNYEIIFGDNTIGRQPKNGAVVVIDYRITVGKPANGCSVFSINFDPTSPTDELLSSVSVQTNNIAIGGAPVEETETVRFYAPRWFQTQERAIVPSDYEVLLKTQYPEINAVSVYGGETVIPPQFGKVIVAIDISNVEGLPISNRDKYFEFLKARCPIAITPVFITPEYVYLRINTLIRYNVNVTNETISRIRTLVLAAISDFNDVNLNDFNVTFRFSKLIRALDDADPSILSNITNISLYKKVYPTPNVTQNIILSFGVPLLDTLPVRSLTHDLSDEKTLTSSYFKYKGEYVSLEDDGLGNINIVKTDGNNLQTITNIGVIQYDTGLVQLNNFTLDSYEGTCLHIYVRPADNDITVSKNVIMLIESENSQVNVEQIRQVL